MRSTLRASSSPWSAGRALRVVGGVVAGLAVGGLALSTPAYAASSTTVTPAGDTFQSSLVSGVTATFTVGSYSVYCSVSSTTGAVPASPNNVSADGAVSSTLTAPTFTSCTTSSILFSASTATNSTNGNWGVALQYDSAGSTATLSIPQGGVVVTTTGLAACTITVAPSAATTMAGTWTAGSGTTLPQIGFSSVTVPVTVTGNLFCPTASTTATFSATYQVADTTDSTQLVAVTA